LAVPPKASLIEAQAARGRSAMTDEQIIADANARDFYGFVGHGIHNS
jgi:hypothetical protein